MGEVWMLHRVLPEEQCSASKQFKNVEITLAFLESRIVEYKRNGYQFVSIEQVCDALSGKAERLKHFVCITLDDGYSDNYDYAYPLFKKYNIPFAIYITSGFIDGSAPMWWYKETPSMMSWEQLQQLSQDSLCTIGAHTVTHPRLGQIDLEQARKEIVDSKRRIEEKLNINIEHFSYPHGDYSHEVRQLVYDSNFKSSVLVWGGKVRPGHDCFEIPRIPIMME